MNKTEKNARRAELSKYINLGNGRFKDHEIEKLESLVENRDRLDGTVKTYRRSYKTFDSEDTYRVEENDTYTFRSGDGKIHIERDFERHWDDGQDNYYHEDYDTGRAILGLISKLFE